MHLVRFSRPGSDAVGTGILVGDTVRTLPDVTVSDLLSRGADAFRAALTGPTGPELPAAEVSLLSPVDGLTEVWAAGVTYERSRAARVEESGQASAYELVYGADRPELFFKAPAWRVVGPGGPVTVRADSGNDVPEPELGLVLDPDGVLVGYLVGNDMTARAIEGQNPLYLPQAKIWRGSCALGPGIRPAWELTDPGALDIDMAIRRSGTPVFTGHASTAQLHRGLPELVSWLYRELAFPAGAVLLTGTCVVPELAFTLRSGDVIDIAVTGVGRLTNPVA